LIHFKVSSDGGVLTVIGSLSVNRTSLPPTRSSFKIRLISFFYNQLWLLVTASVAVEYIRSQAALGYWAKLAHEKTVPRLLCQTAMISDSRELKSEEDRYFPAGLSRRPASTCKNRQSPSLKLDRTISARESNN